MTRRRRWALVVAVLLLTLAALAAVQPSAVVSLLARAIPDIVWRVETRAPLVALTFDDGPDPRYTPQVLDILAGHGARATFFLVGERTLAHPALLQRIRREGHEVGNHTWKDATTIWMSVPRFKEELMRTEGALGLGGARPKLFRPAGGWVRPAQLRHAEAHGYTCVLGSAYAFDPYRPPAGYIRWAIARKLRPGAIAVLHDAGGDRSRTVAALPGILTAAKAKGLRVVTVSELLASAALP